MGDSNPFRRFLRRLSESDEHRLAEDTKAWARAVPGAVLVAEAPLREPVRIAGIVRRITVHPEHGLQTLEAILSDGSGEMSVLWMGRRTIEGLTLGTRVVVEGVVGEQHQRRRMVNPSFEFA